MFGRDQQQTQKQKSLHKMKVALDTFYNVLEPLEEYIEKSGNYPRFISKRQIYRKNIQDSEGPLENDEDLFLSNLYIFARTFHGKPEFFMKVIQEDFYKWINVVGITAENSHEELKHFLIEINNILEGNDEKIIQESVERNKNIEIDPKEMVGIFAGIQNPLNKNRWQRKELEGRKWSEISEEDRLKGDPDLGRQEFERIKRNVSIPHENFRLRYFGKKRSTQQLTSYEIIKEFTNNPNFWRIGMVEGYEYLIHDSAKGNNNHEIKVLIHNKEKFGEAEWIEINEVLELNKQYKKTVGKLNGEISPEYLETREGLETYKKELEKKLLISGIRRNADKWEIREEVVILDFKGGIKSKVLIRKTVTIDEEDYDLTGELKNRSNEFYKEDYFDAKDLAEINSIFTAYKINEKISQNRDNWMIATVGNNGYEIVLNKETALLNNGGKKNLNVNGEYYKKEQFTDKEWTEIENNLYDSQNHQSSVKKLTLSEIQKNSEDNGLGKIFSVLGITTVLITSSIIVVKKQVFRKFWK